MNLTVRYVQPEFVQQVWPEVEEFISSALQYGAGEYSAEQLKVLVVRNEHILLVAVDEENKLHGAATVQFINYPNHRVAFVTAIGGKLISNPNTFQQLVAVCKANGATRIQGAARESIERLWRKLFKFERSYAIVEKDI